MKLGNFFSKFSRNFEEKRENFLALEITDETVKAATWSVIGKNVKVLRLGSIEEWEKKDDLLKATDSAVTSACEEITPEPVKVIFGLPQDWVEEDSITSSKKPILANLCENLGLKPVGFVVSLEALTAYLKFKQGVPPSAIFVRLGQTEIVVSLVSLGKVVGSKKVGRSQDLALDIKEGLARFKEAESLPARIILFDGLVDFEEAKQQIISFDWLSNLSFLHFPKVESFGRDFVMRAIAIAGGTEVAKSLGFEILEVGKKSNTEAQRKTTPKALEKTEKVEARKDKSSVPSENSVSSVLQKKEEFKEELKDEEIEKKTEDQISAQDLGFVEGKDVRQLKTMEKEEEKELIIKGEKEETLEKEKKDFLIRSKSNKRYFKSLFSGFLSFIVFLMRFFPKKRIIFLVLPFIFFIFAGFFAYLYLLKAEIVLYFSPQKIEEEVSFKLDSKASLLNEEEKIIPAEKLTIEVEGEGEQQTSGEKLVGEKAHGKVTIYNKTELSKSFAAGTVLLGEDNLKFVLDDEVTVASRSTELSNEGEAITWGKKTAEASAVELGEESNREAGSNFTFKDYPSSSFVAKAEEGLTGGSSEKVRSVTKKDRDVLLDKLTQELQQKAKDELSAKVSADKMILDKDLLTTVSKKDFDKQVGEEGETLKLKLTISVNSFSFRNEDLKKFLGKQLVGSIPSDLVLAEGDFQTEITEVETEEDEAAVKMIAKANLTPKLEIERLKKELAGKTTTNAEAYLLSLPNFVRAKIDISPSFLGKFRTLPRISKNIDIEIKVE